MGVVALEAGIGGSFDADDIDKAGHNLDKATNHYASDHDQDLHHDQDLQHDPTRSHMVLRVLRHRLERPIPPRRTVLAPKHDRVQVSRVLSVQGIRPWRGRGETSSRTQLTEVRQRVLLWHRPAERRVESRRVGLLQSVRGRWLADSMRVSQWYNPADSSGSWRLSLWTLGGAAAGTTSPTTTRTTTTQRTTTSPTQTTQTPTPPPAAAAAVTKTVPSSSSPKCLWAHHIVGNTYPYTYDTWMSDIRLASSSGIDGFA